MCVNPRKSKVSGFPRPRRFADFVRQTARTRSGASCPGAAQSELRAIAAAVSQESFGIFAMLEPHHEIVRVTDDDHFATGCRLPPLMDPQVET